MRGVDFNFDDSFWQDLLHPFFLCPDTFFILLPITFLTGSVMPICRHISAAPYCWQTNCQPLVSR